MVVEVVGRADLALGVENRVRGGGGGGGWPGAVTVWKEKEGEVEKMTTA